MKKLAIIVAFLFFEASAVIAEPDFGIVILEGDKRDHLEPDNSVFEGHNGYYTLLVSAMEEGFADDVKARVLVVPSFSEEVLVGLRGRPGSFEIFSLRPQISFWYFYGSGLYDPVSPGDDWSSQIAAYRRESEREEDIASPGRVRRKTPEDYKDVELSRCAIKIDDALANDILRAWQTVLRDTRYYGEHEGIVGSDGTSFHFWSQAFPEDLAGKIWVPSGDLRPGKLALVAEAMTQYCSASGAAARSNSLRNLKDRLQALTK